MTNKFAAAAAFALAAQFASVHASTGAVAPAATVAPESSVCAEFSGSGSAPDLSKLDARQLADFYKANKDFGKKRLEIDYSAYGKSDWLVVRGTLCASGAAVPSFPVQFRFNGSWRPSVTGPDGGFAMEIRKSEIEPSSAYRFDVAAGRYSQWAVAAGSELLSGSVYDFKIVSPTALTGAYVFSIHPVHGDIFPEGPMGFSGDELRVPSAFGIQGFKLFMVVLAVAALVAATWVAELRRRSAEDASEHLKKG